MNTPEWTELPFPTPIRGFLEWTESEHGPGSYCMEVALADGGRTFIGLADASALDALAELFYKCSGNSPVIAYRDWFDFIVETE